MTGYPPELLDLDLDLEADLGVDTVKQAEVFAAVRERFDVERDDNLALRDFPTLTHVIGWVRDKTGIQPAAGGTCCRTSPAPPDPTHVGRPAAPRPGCRSPGRRSPPLAAAPAADEVTDAVVGIVAEMTGYPPELLDLDLDLEADLGVDTVKQAEVFAAVRDRFDVERDDNLALRDFPTLTHVIGWVRDKTGIQPTVGAAATARHAPIRRHVRRPPRHRHHRPRRRAAAAARGPGCRRGHRRRGRDRRRDDRLPARAARPRPRPRGRPRRRHRQAGRGVRRRPRPVRRRTRRQPRTCATSPP